MFRSSYPSDAESIFNDEIKRNLSKAGRWKYLSMSEMAVDR